MKMPREDLIRSFFQETLVSNGALTLPETETDTDANKNAFQWDAHRPLFPIGEGVGVYFQGGLCLGGGFLCPGGLCHGDPLPPCRQTDICENITLPQTSFAGGNKLTQNPMGIRVVSVPVQYEHLHTILCKQLFISLGSQSRAV